MRGGQSVENRRQLLFRNLVFGAVLGAGIGALQVASTQSTTTNAILLGHIIGGALGGAVLVLLASTILRWLFK
jgi:hypothetical protein